MLVFKKRSGGQVWIETVIYTLIGIAVIGILLAVSKPKIDSMKDKLIIEQTIESMNNINEKVSEIQTAPGNKRVIELKVSKGSFIVDSVNDRIMWTLNSKYKYSEPNLEVKVGDQKIKTLESSPYKIEVWIDYDDYNLQFNGKEDLKELSGAPSPYFLSVENKGVDSSGKIVIDFFSS